MTKYPWLTLRGRTFYLRAPVLADIQGTFGRREIWKTLGTQDRKQALTQAREDLYRFAEERGLKIAATYAEHESGASLKRPELFRLLTDCHPGDVLLVEQVDRLSRLNAGTGNGSRPRSMAARSRSWHWTSPRRG